MVTKEECVTVSKELIDLLIQLNELAPKIGKQPQSVRSLEGLKTELEILGSGSEPFLSEDEVQAIKGYIEQCRERIIEVQAHVNGTQA